MTGKDILNLIEKDEWMMGILRVAEKLNFPDWVIDAGFVRNLELNFQKNTKSL